MQRRRASGRGEAGSIGLSMHSGSGGSARWREPARGSREGSAAGVTRSTCAAAAAAGRELREGLGGVGARGRKVGGVCVGRTGAGAGRGADGRIVWEAWSVRDRESLS